MPSRGLLSEALILWIITVYEPDPAEWVNPVTRRVV